MIRESRGSFFLLKARELYFKMPIAVKVIDYREYCHGINQYECACVILQQIHFFSVFKCYIISIKNNINIVWNELFQTVPGICIICVQCAHNIDQQSVAIKWSGKFL